MTASMLKPSVSKISISVPAQAVTVLLEWVVMASDANLEALRHGRQKLRSRACVLGTRDWGWRFLIRRARLSMWANSDIERIIGQWTWPSTCLSVTFVTN